MMWVYMVLSVQDATQCLECFEKEQDAITYKEYLIKQGYNAWVMEAPVRTSVFVQGM